MSTTVFGIVITIKVAQFYLPYFWTLLFEVM